MKVECNACPRIAALSEVVFTPGSPEASLGVGGGSPSVLRDISRFRVRPAGRIACTSMPPMSERCRLTRGAPARSSRAARQSVSGNTARHTILSCPCARTGSIPVRLASSDVTPSLAQSSDRGATLVVPGYTRRRQKRRRARRLPSRTQRDRTEPWRTTNRLQRVRRRRRVAAR
jgi:hypothetical protein